jgi:hypothetical protein
MYTMGAGGKRQNSTKQDMAKQQHAEVLVTRPFSQQGPLYGIGCHNPSGLPITFHHSKAFLKHIYFLNAILM